MQTLRHIRQTILAAALLFAASSCSDIAETAIGAGGIGSDPAYANRACYFVFEIDTGKDDPQTRATTYDDEDPDSKKATSGDLVYGTEDEHKIGRNGNYAFFFDESGILQAITGLSLSTDDHDLKPESEKPTDETTGDGSANGETDEDDENEKRRKENQYSDKIEARYTTLLRSTEKNFPKEGWRVLVVLNGQGLYSELTNKFIVGTSTEEQVQNYVWTETADPNKIGFVEVDEEGKKERRFVMTNSVYDKGLDPASDGRVPAAVPITKEMIHEVNDENDPIPPELVFENEEEILKIRVERMVSKFTLDFDYETSDDYLEDGEFKEIVDVSSGEKKMIYKPAVTKKLDRNHQVVLCTGWTNVYKSDEENIATEDWEPILELKSWKAQVLGWGMNALEKQSYLYKNIKKDKKYFSDWNSTDYYRSYWAEDKHYDENYYPWQYRRAVDKKLNWYGNDNDNGTNVYTGEPWVNHLQNYSWNDSHLNYQPGKDADGNDIVIYTPENTYDATKLVGNFDLDGRTDLLAGTHLIIPARLWIQDDNKNDNYNDPNDIYDSQLDDNYKIFKTLYRDRTGVCYTSARDCLWGLIRAFNYQLSSQTKMRYHYYNWSKKTDSQNESFDDNSNVLYAAPSILYDTNLESTDEKDKSQYYYKLYYGDIELTYDYIMDKNGSGLTEDDCAKLLAEATVKDGDGKRLLNTSGFSIKRVIDNSDPLNIITQDLPIFNKYNVGVFPYDDVTEDGIAFTNYREYDNSGFYERTTSSDANDIQSLLYEWIGAVDFYKEGMMYYPYPVTIKENVYGTVRNSWYRFKVAGINNVGISVYDVNEPIVPNWDETFDQMNVKVKILPWHEISYPVDISEVFPGLK